MDMNVDLNLLAMSKYKFLLKLYDRIWIQQINALLRIERMRLKNQHIRVNMCTQQLQQAISDLRKERNVNFIPMLEEEEIDYKNVKYLIEER